jgi:MFS family permease
MADLRSRALVPVLAYVGFVVAIVSSLGNTLVPIIATEFHVSLVSAQWSVTITLLTGAVLTPTLGRLSDGPRRRRVLIGALSAVFVGSLVAALPLPFGFLMIGRALQGAGLALNPLTMSVARSCLPLERARPAISLLSVASVAGVGVGYPITGLLSDSFGVHGGFWFGAVASGVAAMLAIWVLPTSSDSYASRLDWPGAILFGTALVTLLLAVSQAEVWGWGSPRILGLFMVAVVLLACWSRQALHTENPLVELRLLAHGPVLAANATGLLGGLGVYLILGGVTRFVQTPASTGYGFGMSVLAAGFVILPMSILSVITGRTAQVLSRRMPLETLLPFGAAFFLIAMLFSLLGNSHLWAVLSSSAAVASR